ncbi:MAG TPA: hypothetical protein VE131_15170 [Terriglobales bacterium]|nr:hypothetical protein [Terriglobales bacterium]
MAYTLENLLTVLRPHCAAKVDALCKTRRRVEHGLTTVGLKIHCLGDNRELLRLIDALGGQFEVIDNRRYAHARASVTVVLPPLGSARSAIWLLECIEMYFGHSIFHNPRYQIQVCSPCRLDGPRAALLAIAFYLGSDVLRRYSLDDLTTTFSQDILFGHKHRGRRIVLYDGDGDLDRNFEWWDLEKGRLSIRPRLPFVTERTDVLTCQSKIDIENVNLMATLLSHDQILAYWKHLGRRCMAEIEALLQRHLLAGILHVPWIHPATGKRADDRQFFYALQELMTYAFDEYARLEKERRNQAGQSTSDRPGILAEMQALLWRYRAELLAQSVGLWQEKAK